MTMLVVPTTRGEPPPGLKLVQGPHGDHLVAARNFDLGEIVLRDRGILRPPRSLPPLAEFRPLPDGLGDVVMQGEGFPWVSIFDKTSIKLLFAFQQASPVEQADILAMQDFIDPMSECAQSIDLVAEYLHGKNLSWLEDLSLPFLSKLLRIFCVNAFACSANGVQASLYFWGAKFNHSCNANIDQHSESADGEVWGVFTALRAIQEGEILGLSYFNLRLALTSLPQRRRMLWWLKGFVCECDRCCHETVHLDAARTLACVACGEPSIRNADRFICKCGHRAPEELVRDEARIMAVLTRALATGYPTEDILSELQQGCHRLPQAHVARHALTAIQLSEEKPSDVTSWLHGIWDSENWLRTRGLTQGGMRCFRFAAPVLAACTHVTEPWVPKLRTWAMEVGDV